MSVNLTDNEIEEIVMKAVQKALQAAHHEFVNSG